MNIIIIIINQTQKHAVVKSMAGRVKSGQSNFTAFSNIFNSDNFQKRCDAAALDQNGPVARRILHDVLPMVWFLGEPVLFGPAECAQSIAGANAMVYRFGPPIWLFTFAPDYTDPFTIHISIIANRSRSS